MRNIWKNLRQEFGKQLKKNLRSGSGAPDEPTSSWPYYQSMLFLTDQFLPRKSSGNLASKDNNDDVMSDFSDDEQQTTDPEPQGDVNIDNEFEPFNETPSASTSHAISVSSNRRTMDSKMANAVVTKTGYIKRVTPQTVIGQQLLEIEKEKLKLKQNKSTQDQNDEDVGFFNSLLPHVKQLTPRDKLSFRMQVQNILFNMAYPPEPSPRTDPTPSPLAFQYSRSTSSASYINSPDENYGNRVENEDSNGRFFFNL